MRGGGGVYGSVWVYSIWAIVGVLDGFDPPPPMKLARCFDPYFDPIAIVLTSIVAEL